jgi:hypothetical protein
MRPRVCPFNGLDTPPGSVHLMAWMRPGSAPSNGLDAPRVCPSKVKVCDPGSVHLMACMPPPPQGVVCASVPSLPPQHAAAGQCAGHDGRGTAFCHGLQARQARGEAIRQTHLIAHIMCGSPALKTSLTETSTMHFSYLECRNRIGHFDPIQRPYIGFLRQ